MKSAVNPFVDFFFFNFFSESPSLVLTSKYLSLFEVAFYSVFYLIIKIIKIFCTKSVIPFLLAKFACANLPVKFSLVNLLNSCVVIYLSCL